MTAKPQKTCGTTWLTIWAVVSLLVWLISVYRFRTGYPSESTDDIWQDLRGAPPSPSSPSSPSSSSFESWLNLAQSVPSEESLEEWLRYYTSMPHVAGTKRDFEQVQWTASKWKEFGLPEVVTDAYFPLLNYPRERRVAIVEPANKRFQCTLREDPVNGDDTSGRYRDAVPSFHGYSANGNVTGRLVYVNYGRLEDFEFLKGKGVDFRGTIALVKYGRNFRGLKVRAAELHGCAGVLIYSDPYNDGFVRGKTYPDGPWRPDSSVQRGSVHYMSLQPGDPSTPGYPATKDAPRVAQADSKALPKIPSLPLSYRDAQPLLASLHGLGWNSSDAPDGWKGGLDMDYWTGPGNVQVNLVNHVDFEIRPIWNIMARINGTDEADKAIIVGNHRDAWGMGAVDPASGSSCLTEMARTLGQLLAAGWRPRRTIILASWDGEEYGMVGSVEYVEERHIWLKKAGVAYLNVDTAVSGPEFRADATPSLAQMIRQVTMKVMDPQTGKSVYDRWLHSSPGLSTEPARAVVGELGSGSDFVGFVDYAGMAAVNFHFSGDYGVYHSNYDSFHWMETFGDPGFHYHAAATKVWTLMAMELAETRFLPFDYQEYAHELRRYIGDLEARIPAKEKIRFENMRAAVDAIENAAMEITKLAECKHLKSMHLCDTLKMSFNERLIQAERAFLDEQGIPGRTWYKHVVYAPGLWSGYGADTFPTLAEAIEAALGRRRSWSYVMSVEQHLADILQLVAKQLRGV